MKKLLIVTALSLSFFPGIINAAYDGLKLKEICFSEKIAEKAVCMGYLMGCMDFIVDIGSNSNVKRVCSPNNLTVGQLTEVVKKYMINFPENLNLPGPAIVLFSLIEYFPCSEPDKQSNPTSPK